MNKLHFLFVVLLAPVSVLYPQTVIRINQLGYLPGSVKVAILMTSDSVFTARRWNLRDALTDEIVWESSEIVADVPYGRFKVSRLDFSSFAGPGAYSISIAAERSPVFSIASDVYDNTADFLLQYMRQQRCGYNPFLDDSCHTHDGYIIYHPRLDSTFIDVVGGWHDASDYLQYVTTSATAVFQMLFAYEQHPESFRDAVGANGRSGSNGIPDILDEVKWGLEWLVKMNPASAVMFHQIADDRDHMGFRLPTLDTINYGKGLERPVYFCTGKPQGVQEFKNRTTGIASIAGKFASSFALGSQLLQPYYPDFCSTLRTKARDAYRWGQENPGVCQTAPCRAPYFYEEDNWVDDMELAATQLYRLTGEIGYIHDAMQYGEAETVVPWMGADGARHYQWYPFVNLGHYYLSALSRDDTAAHVIGWIKDGIERIRRRGSTRPFHFGVPFIWCSNNLVSATLTELRIYGQLSNDSSGAEMEAALRDWLFGCNPWGTSMVIGLPRVGIAPHDPHSAFTHVNNYPIDGGLVDGPVRASIFNSLKGVKLSKEDPFREFQSDSVVYHDDWADYSTNEPTMDGTAGLTYYLSALESEGKASSFANNGILDRGAFVRMDPKLKEIYLVFTGHEFADGGPTILNTLRKHHIKASFFFTGDFYREQGHRGMIAQLVKDGHYLGPHSDKHLLYAPWEERDSLLVTKEEFLNDLRDNYHAMTAFGIRKSSAPVFLPPFEWYNAQVAEWCREVGVRLVNFTPGTRSNADYTVPGVDRNYRTSAEIEQSIFAAASAGPEGLNGFILLTHFGTDPRRTDKLYTRLEEIIVRLTHRGYSFRRF